MSFSVSSTLPSYVLRVDELDVVDDIKFLEKHRAYKTVKIASCYKSFLSSHFYFSCRQYSTSPRRHTDMPEGGGIYSTVTIVCLSCCFFKNRLSAVGKKDCTLPENSAQHFVLRNKQFLKLLSKKHIFISKIIVNTSGLRYL